ncbi:hypothetical protein NLU13_9224 [Sarocladium strictum]|uniref:Nuclear pore complex protein n=1 Tax=Sarocladium strictum TaxID=5046 RepID=A0AA39L3N5_SARSR|nr:hypothetical protein NLU13_9224 [Sarocladium strictum]
MNVDLDDALPLSAVESGPEVEEFANALDDCLSPLLKPAEKRRRLLELPQKYYDNALRRLAQHDPRRARLSYDEMDVEGDDVDFVNDIEERDIESKKLEKEVQTWDLFRRLLPLRYTDQKSNTSSLRPSMSAQSKPRDLLHDFLESDTVAQERRAVIQWLQSNAASRPDIDDLVRDLQQNADRGDIIAHGWLHTRSSIKLRKSVTSWSGLLDKQSPNVADSHSTNKGDPLVTQLDPDATTRQNRKLQPQDEFFERAIWLGCFEHLRRGSSLKTIRDWCAERTEMWRAISMSAMLLSVDDKEPVPDTDARSLALWRRMCYGLARQGGTDDYERAVYGVLSGDVPSVEKVSKSWDDQLFAKYNSLLRTQFDQYLLSRCPAEVASDLTRTFSTFDAAQFHSDKDASAQLISSLATHPEFGKEAREPSKALQAAFIANELRKYLYDQGRAISETADADQQMIFASPTRSQSAVNLESFFRSNDLDGLRVVAHVYLLVTLLDSMDGKQDGSEATSADDVQGNTLAGYTTFLRRANLKELIPLYCSVLERPRCYEVLVSNLILETDHESRRNQLRLMKKVSIDIAEFVRFQASIYFKGLGQAKPQGIRKRNLSILDDKPSSARAGKGIKADFFGSDEDEVEDLHQYMARSLEWMMLIDETWPDVFAYGAQAYKFFLGNMHLTAARHLLERVTTTDIIKAMGLTMEEVDDYMFTDVNFWAGQLADHGIVSVSPQKVMLDARNFRELESLVRVLDNLETIGSLVELSAEAPASNREYWAKMGAEVKATKDSVQPLLSEWLLTGIAAGDKELLRLRQTYLTETILAYVSALHFAGTTLSRDYHLECMELASTIAEGESDLAASFLEAGRMRELVEAFAACSKALAVATGGAGRSAGVSNKKLREMGWSRDLWSVKS